MLNWYTCILRKLAVVRIDLDFQYVDHLCTSPCTSMCGVFVELCVSCVVVSWIWVTMGREKTPVGSLPRQSGGFDVCHSFWRCGCAEVTAKLFGRRRERFVASTAFCSSAPPLICCLLQGEIRLYVECARGCIVFMKFDIQKREKEEEVEVDPTIRKRRGKSRVHFFL